MLQCSSLYRCLISHNGMRKFKTVVYLNKSYLKCSQQSGLVFQKANYRLHSRSKNWTLLATCIRFLSVKRCFIFYLFISFLKTFPQVCCTNPFCHSPLIFRKIDNPLINDETITVEGSQVILCDMVTGKHIFVIAKVYIQNLREIPKLYKSMDY